jgi:hypothetical protein
MHDSILEHADQCSTMHLHLTTYDTKGASMNLDFTSKNKTIKFTYIPGEVIGTSKFSETQISSSGGAAYAGELGAYASAPRIHSTSIINHEFWIKSANGQEHEIKLTGVDIPLREGQQVTAVIAEDESSKKWDYVFLVNHSTGNTWTINTASALCSKLDLHGDLSLRSLVKLAGYVIAFGMIFVAPSMYALIAFGSGTYFLVKGYQSRKSCYEKFSGHLKNTEKTIISLGSRRGDNNESAAKFIFDLLTLANKKSASKIIIEPGHPPKFSINEKIVDVSESTLTAAHCDGLISAVMNDEQYIDFQSKKSAKFLINPRSIGQFQVDVFANEAGARMVLTPNAIT